LSSWIGSVGHVHTPKCVGELPEFEFVHYVGRYIIICNQNLKFSG
jgi:hypothetical protein